MTVSICVCRRGRTYRNLPLVQSETWLGLDEVQVWRDLFLLEDQNRFDQPGETAGGLRVTDVGLHRTHVQISSPRLFAKYITQRLGLSVVTRFGSRAVGLDIQCLVGVETSTSIHTPNQGLLGIGVRQRDSICLPVLVGSRVTNHGVNRVAVLKGVSQPLDDDGGNTFSATVAGSSAVEHVALAVCVEHAGKKQSALARL